MRLRRKDGAEMTDAALSENHVFENAEALARNVAEWLCRLAQASDRAFAVSLSGGSTPRRLYECLAAPAIASRFPWDRAHWFWGDERFVPHDHPDSNYRMAREAFLVAGPCPSRQHPCGADRRPVAGPSRRCLRDDAEAFLWRRHARARSAAVRRHAAWESERTDTPRHCFPGSRRCKETRRWAVAVIGAKAEARITLTYPALDSSRDLAFVVTGREKREVVARAQEGDRTIPAGVIRPVGRRHWFTDRAAASERAH